MSFLSLAQVESRVNELARRIGAPGGLLPTFGRSDDSARPHVEVDARGNHVAIVERGQELERFTTGTVDELLYRVFADVTFSMATAHELRHRAKGPDPRRLLFATQVDLLSRLSPGWARRQARAHETLLRTHPFRDGA